MYIISDTLNIYYLIPEQSFSYKILKMIIFILSNSKFNNLFAYIGLLYRRNCWCFLLYLAMETSLINQMTDLQRTLRDLTQQLNDLSTTVQTLQAKVYSNEHDDAK